MRVKNQLELDCFTGDTKGTTVGELLDRMTVGMVKYAEVFVEGYPAVVTLRRTHLAIF